MAEKRDIPKRIADNTLVALTLMIAESRTEPNFNAHQPLFFYMSCSCVLKNFAWVLQIFQRGGRIGGLNVIAPEGHRGVTEGTV